MLHQDFTAKIYVNQEEVQSLGVLCSEDFIPKLENIVLSVEIEVLKSFIKHYSPDLFLLLNEKLRASNAVGIVKYRDQLDAIKVPVRLSEYFLLAGLETDHTYLIFSSQSLLQI